jgi:beta-xylosidase
MTVSKFLLLFLFCTILPAQTYKNPVLLADYSDPDVIRDGSDYYLIASSFHFVPGIPILHSKDLVHWEISGHVVKRLNFSPAYNMEGGNRYAGGIWAPSVRFHKGLFYVYFPTPNEGIFVATAPKMTGPWSEPVAVLPGPGYEDPCPFWDDDGKAWLVHSRLRAGPLILHRMAEDGKSVLDPGKVIVQDSKELPTLEGPKFYKRNGWYYLFAPMGGVGEGAQAVMRSRMIEGPYEHRIVLAQGSTTVNGPHQGGYVETPDGLGWFLHFQQRGPHGRIVHLEPVTWKDDWPIMGKAGEPVDEAPLPVIVPDAAKTKPQTSDEFNAVTLSPMWEWNHNPEDSLWSLTERKGFLRLHPGYATDLAHARNTLTEVMQDEALDLTVRMDTQHMAEGDRAGISLFDKSISSIAVVQVAGEKHLIFTATGQETTGPAVVFASVQLRLHFNGEAVSYFYSTDEGKTSTQLGIPVRMVFSWWKGARPAIFSYSTDSEPHPNHYVDVDWAHYQAQNR